jgi:sugar lactone lactonase YvrE
MVSILRNSLRVTLLFIALTASELTTSNPVAEASNLQVLAVVGGQPDDITVDGKGRLVWGDLARGTIERLAGGRAEQVAGGLSVPEGIVVMKNGSLIVAEQGSDRIDLVDKRGRTTVLDRLHPVQGQEGVDGIGFNAKTDLLLVPDSPRGDVLGLNLKTKHVRVLASRLGRPVDAAVDRHGNVLVPDEHLGSLVVIGPRGQVSSRGNLSTPDDVAVDASGHIWVTTLGDGGLWMLPAHGSPRRVLVGLQNPQGLTLDRCGDPIIVEQGSARIVRLLLAGSHRSCAY